MTSTYGDRLRQALSDTKTSRKALADRLGISESAVGAVVNGRSRSFDARNHVLACAMLGISPLWLADGVGSKWVDGQAPSVAGMARPARPVVHTVAPLVTWGELMHTAVDELPEEFRVDAPDGALSTRLDAGQVVTLRRDLVPARGDAVLVLDAAGGYHLRVYRPTIGDRWQAAALNADFPPLESERDGLRVLAVLTGIEARWS